MRSVPSRLQAPLAGGDRALPRRVVRIDLAHEKDFVAPARDRLGDQLLRFAFAIHLGGVDQRRAEVETQPQRRDLFRPRTRIVPDVPGSLAVGGHALPRRQSDAFHFGNRLTAFSRCEVSPARCVQMMPSRTSLSAIASMTPPAAPWMSRFRCVTRWTTVVE